MEARLKPIRLSPALLAALSCIIEAFLCLSDFGLLGSPSQLRLFAYHFGAFWPGLLADWKPNYAAQPYLMFLTYGFLHSGAMHLLVNMITLFSLSKTILDRVGQASFLAIYFGAGLGGAAGFALLAPDLRPMVGASGALFGLFGAVLAWRYRENDGRVQVAGVISVLAALNLVLWYAMDGQLAWQAHLGGFLSGWAIALLFKPKPLAGSDN